MALYQSAGQVALRGQQGALRCDPAAAPGLLTVPGLLIVPGLVRTPAGGTQIGARVTMLCDCPITPGGLWDEAHYRIVADVIDHDTVVQHLRLRYTGGPSEFAGDLPGPTRPGLPIRIVATQSTAPNTGEAIVPIPRSAFTPRRPPVGVKGNRPCEKILPPGHGVLCAGRLRR